MAFARLHWGIPGYFACKSILIQKQNLFLQKTLHFITPRFWTFLQHCPMRDHTNLQSHYQKLSFHWVLMVIWLCWALFRITGDKMGGVHVLCGPPNNQLSATTDILFSKLFNPTVRKLFKLSRKIFCKFESEGLRICKIFEFTWK